MMWWYGPYQPWMWVGMVLMIIFWIAVIWIIIWGIQRFASHEHQHGAVSGSNALDIARERYARGEITKDQFEQIKKDLS